MKVTDVIYALRQQFARHGIQEECFTDNSPFGAAEFKAFALVGNLNILQAVRDIDKAMDVLRTQSKQINVL